MRGDGDGHAHEEGAGAGGIAARLLMYGAQMMASFPYVPCDK
jgi:hypothetical protein